jgi:hypothetical protein
MAKSLVQGINIVEDFELTSAIYAVVFLKIHPHKRHESAAVYIVVV